MADKIKPKEPEAFYGSLFDNMLDGLAYCQMIFGVQKQPVDFIYLKVNKNFEKLTGLKDVEGKKVSELIPGITMSNPELFEIYGRVALGGKPERFETYAKVLARWFLVSVYSAKKEFFTAVFQNITDQKQIKKELEDARIAAQNVFEDLSIEKSELEIARAKEEAILFSIGDGLMAVDKSGTVTVINESAQNMLGFTSKEIMGKPWIEVIQMEDEKGNQILKEKRPVTMALSHSKTTTTTTTTTGPTYYYVRKDKTKFPVAITATPVKLEGKMIGVIAVFRDITREIEVDKAKSEFVSLASHQLRTPLGIIKWYLEILQKEDYLQKAPQQTKEYFDEVYKSNERVLSLVRDLLSVSRIDQGCVKNAPKSVDIIKMVKEIVEQMQIGAHKKNVVLNLTIEDEKIPPIFIDELRVREVIENLIGNAIEYTQPTGSADVTIKKQGGALLLSVKDTGIGISPVDQKKLFTKFFRSENAAGYNPEGSGLGLYVVKSYVEGWGGKISVKSSAGEGSTFTIALPISQKKDILEEK